MSVALELAALMAYSDQERKKWRTWIEADPSRLSIPFQRGGRFPLTAIHILETGAINFGAIGAIVQPKR